MCSHPLVGGETQAFDKLFIDQKPICSSFLRLYERVELERLGECNFGFCGSHRKLTLSICHVRLLF